MIYSVKITGQAETDLREIYKYIAYELRSTQNAAAQLDRLEQNIYSLNQMPERYRRYEKEPWFSRGWRIMPVDRYCVFYMLDYDRKIVNITRVGMEAETWIMRSLKVQKTPDTAEKSSR